MRWSKTRKHLLDFLAPSLKGKLDYKYGKNDNSNDGILSIVFNDEVVFTFYESLHFHRGLFNKIRKQHPTWNNNQIWDCIHKMELYSEYSFLKAIDIYLQQSIKESLNSDNKLVMILALLDRRVGKRTLQKLSYLYLTNVNDIVIKIYNLRFNAEFGEY